ncbi:aminoacyl-tRNA deacylase [Anaerococcus sp.]|uniref:aminoacyl-tRNA deacylase n=1 Tax=Anaerococcus sp. TaxID=1872515 RepID=UPI00257A62D4|nr:aminoacyl-tRNA deacylase [Anaerococcus sp.]MBS6105623.1 aminoacyl-tRNA deacylase [Anaerococcus sp.]
MKKEIKTNAMRALDKLNIEYEHIDYGFEGEFKSTVDLTEETHQDISVVYKTLATISNTKDIYIFVIPGAENIDFKKASRCVGVKSLEMLPLKDLKSKVGYERGATTSLAMKKNYDVVIDESAKDHDYIKVSAGKVGHSVKIKAEDLAKANDAKFFDVIQK